MSKTLHIAPGLDLPLEAVTQTFGILARKRVGKSNTAVVMAEEMYDAGLPWVAIDPKGDWWGIRAAGDGKGPGLSVVVFGGEHGDVPLDPLAGKMIADLLVDQRLTCVLDVSEMFITSKAATQRFLTDFAAQLYARNREPLHVFCEEADEYIPQMVRGDDAKMVSAFERLVKRGGFRGIGITLITQRSASLNNDVLTQVDTLMALQTTGPPDKEAIRKWVVSHELGAEVIKDLPDLQKGEGWVFSPGWLGILKKVRFRKRRTFDSGATPEVGVKARPPATLAAVDIEKLRAKMAATIEKAKAEDPVELRKAIAERDRKIRDLERQKPVAVAQEKVVEKRVEVPVVTEKQLDRIVGILDRGEKLSKGLQAGLSDLTVALLKAGRAPSWPTTQPQPLRVSPPQMMSQDAQPRVPHSTVPHSTPRPPAPRSRVDANGQALGLGERKVLGVLAQWPDGRTQRDLAFLTGYSARASTIGVILSKLRKLGLVEPGQPVRATEAGLAHAGGAPELPTGEALLDYWFSHPRVGEGERKVLRVLVQAFPHPLTHQELGDRTGYSTEASTLGVILSKLRKLGLVESRERKLRPEFAEAIR